MCSDEKFTEVEFWDAYGCSVIIYIFDLLFSEVCNACVSLVRTWLELLMLFVKSQM